MGIIGNCSFSHPAVSNGKCSYVRAWSVYFWICRNPSKSQCLDRGSPGAEPAGYWKFGQWKCGLDGGPGRITTATNWFVFCPGKAADRGVYCFVLVGRSLADKGAAPGGACICPGDHCTAHFFCFVWILAAIDCLNGQRKQQQCQPVSAVTANWNCIISSCTLLPQAILCCNGFSLLIAISAGELLVHRTFRPGKQSLYILGNLASAVGL